MTAWNETVPPGISPAEYHENRVAAVWGVAIACIVVSFISVALRFIARFMSGVKLWWDDWFALANLVFGSLQSTQHSITNSWKAVCHHSTSCHGHDD